MEDLFKYLKKSTGKPASSRKVAKSFFSERKYDFIKFTWYFLIFSVLLFSFQKADSPEGQPDLNSATEINSSTENTVINTDFSIGGKVINKPVLTIEFIPDNIKVDELLLKSVKYNIESKMFKPKVTPLDLNINSLRADPRGQVIGNKLILSGKISDLRESMKVFVHELGHIVDLHFLSNLGDYDPSENFYNISWVSYNVKNKNSKLVDFLSGYALTNKYEDFAESFTFYVFHNEEFKIRARANIKIARKYNFFAKYVFINSEFQNTSFENTSILSYNWDTTKIGVNLKKYLYYIK